jgi:predicted O-linked N-acetylglucosamine transferase (SPINDLY family)
MDYLIADSTLIPEEKKHHYLEKIVYMPYSYQVNMTNREVSKNSLLRDELGLPVKGFVFCSFNNASTDLNISSLLSYFLFSNLTKVN